MYIGLFASQPQPVLSNISSVDTNTTGNANYVLTSGTDVLFQSGTSCSISLWIRCVSIFGGNFPVAFSLRGTSNAFICGLSNNASFSGFWFGVAGGNSVRGGATPTSDVIYHIALTYNGGSVTSTGSYTLWINGVSQSLNTGGAISGSHSNITSVGSNSAFSVLRFEGKVDDFRVFSGVVLSSGQIATLAAGTQTAIGGENIHYKFDENTGTSTVNTGSIGSGADGTLTGANIIWGVPLF